MIKTTLKYIISFILFNIAALYGNTGNVEVRPAGDELIETEPKLTVTTVFRVTNNTSENHEFITEVDLPNHWKLIVQELPYPLNAGESEIKLLSVFVPPTAEAGKYEITYGVRSRQYPSVSDFYTITIHVLPIFKLNVDIIEEPKSVVDGEDYEVTFLVVNGSNIADSITFEVLSDRDFKMSQSLNGCYMLPGESKQVKVSVFPEVETNRSFKHKLNFEAKFVHENKSSGYATSYVEIIPRNPETDPYHRIPVNFKLICVGQKNGAIQSGIQMDISGMGSFDEEGERNIQFRMRAPDIYETSVLAEHDEYFVTYQDTKLFFQLGDRNYTLSPLTEKSRYGRGVEIGYQINRFKLGTFFQKRRLFLPDESQVASYIQYNFKNNNYVKLNYLKKWLDTSNHDILSLETKIFPHQNIELEIEYATGSNAGQIKNAYWLNLYGNHSHKINYFINLVHADTGFPGYYKNINLTSGGIGFYLKNNLRFETNIRQYKDYFDLNDGYTSVLNKYANILLRYHLTNGTALRFGYANRSREDLQPSPRFNYKERTGLFEWSQSFKKISFTAQAEYGQTNNKLSQQTSWMQRYTFNTYFRPTSQMTYKAYMRYDKNQYEEDRKHRLIVGINANIHIAHTTSFYFNYQNNYSPDDYYIDRNVLDFQLRHTFPNNHQINLKARQTLVRNTETGTESAFMVEYNFPFGIPVAKTKNIGIVQGRVFNSETMEPVKDLIIWINGSTAITNKDGYYIFPAIAPNTYYLRIDKSKIGLNRVTVQKTPMEVVVEGGQELNIDLSITRGASLRGQIMVYAVVNDSSDHFSKDKMKDYLDEYYVAGNGNGNGNVHHEDEEETPRSFVTNGKTKLVEDYGLADVLIELQRPDEIQRRVSDKNGFFSFEDIRPGVWQVKLYEYNLPEYYRFDQKEFDINLKPGEGIEQLIKVVPERRQIQFIDESDTVIKSDNGQDTENEDNESSDR